MYFYHFISLYFHFFSCCYLVTKLCLILFDPHGRWHAGFPCPSPSPRVDSNSYPLSQWCYPTISSSVIPFSSCPQSFPAQGLFQWVSSSHQVAKVLELQLQHQFISTSNEYSGLISFRIDWFDLLAVQGTLKSLLQHHIQKHQFCGAQPSLWSNSHICTWLLEKFPSLSSFRLSVFLIIFPASINLAVMHTLSILFIFLCLS